MNITYLGQQTAQSDSPANKQWLFAATTDPIYDDGDVDCQRRHRSKILTPPRVQSQPCRPKHLRPMPFLTSRRTRPKPAMSAKASPAKAISDKPTNASKASHVGQSISGQGHFGQSIRAKASRPSQQGVGDPIACVGDHIAAINETHRCKAHRMRRKAHRMRRRSSQLIAAIAAID